MTQIQNGEWFYWDPHPHAFVIPYLNHPIAWYGICFVLGIIAAYFLLIRVFAWHLTFHKAKLEHSLSDTAQALTERAAWFVILGTIIGARLGHVFFYEWPRYRANPIEILYIWHGGLASHIGVLGIIIGLLLFRWRIRKAFPSLSILCLLDSVAVVCGVVAASIRFGNFINQEILGKVTDLPWAVVFGHPADASMPAPRHPVQLYEAFWYLLTFVVVYVTWKRKREVLQPGQISGILLTMVFSFRFVVELLKESQSVLIGDASLLTMGQYLSIPFVLLGLALYFVPRRSIA